MVRHELSLRWAQARVAVLAPLHRLTATAYDRALWDLINAHQLRAGAH